MQANTLLCWIDLEMTGLNAQTDVILEIASVITDFELQVRASTPSFVLSQPHNVLDSMSVVIKEMHQRSGLLDRVASSSLSVSEAQDYVCEFIVAHTQGAKVLLAGNSVWQDRLFLQAYMPRVLELLHYRIVDVSTMKELIKQWYPSADEFHKKKQHRALDDIYESIAELSYYKKHYFVESKRSD